MGGSGSRLGGPTVRTATNTQGWSYPGIEERIAKLEDAYADAKNQKEVAAVHKSLNAQETVINAALMDIKNGNEFGNESTLLTLRRRIRQLKTKISNDKKL